MRFRFYEAIFRRSISIFSLKNITKFQKKYNTAINKKGVELINTKIMSEGNLKTFINFLYLNEIKAKGINIINIDIKTVREWFNKFQKSRIIVGLD